LGRRFRQVGPKRYHKQGFLPFQEAGFTVQMGNKLLGSVARNDRPSGFEEEDKMIRSLFRFLKHILARVPGIAATQPAAAGAIDLSPELLAQRKTQLARIETVVRRHFGQSIPAADRERFLRVGTLVPLVPSSELRQTVAA